MASVKSFCGNSFCGKCVGWVRKCHEGWTDVEKLAFGGHRNQDVGICLISLINGSTKDETDSGRGK